MRKKRRARRHQSPVSWLVFAAFLLTAVASIIVLEYLDYQRGRDTFIFSTLLRCRRPPTT